MFLRRILPLMMGAALFSGVAAFHAAPVHAQIDAGLNEVGNTVKLTKTDPRVIATRIINVSLGLLGIILVAILVYAGFLYMTSGGEAEKVQRAQKLITSAIIGLVIILSSWAIARFVIDKLLEATRDGGVGSGGDGGGGGGLGGGSQSNAFQVKSITPQGAVPIRNVQVKILFTRAIDEKTVSAIVVSKVGGVTVGGSFAVNGAVVTFTPADPCPAPNQDLKCFDGDTDFEVKVGGSLRSAQGQTIVCGGFATSCTGTFRTGDTIDTADPTAEIIDPLDGRGVPAESLVPFSARSTDDSGVSYVDFFDSGASVGQDAPQGTPTPKDFTGTVQWDTAGIPLQTVRELTAKAYDLDAHIKESAAIHVIVRAPSCFDGVKNGDETDIGCGGTPGTPGYCGACAGGKCAQDLDCGGGMCKDGVCVDQPVITKVSPLDGKPGTFVTIQGLSFGAAGTVTFLGGPGDQDDKVATAPDVCVKLGIKMWTPTQVVVAVPEGASSGPIRVTNGTSKLSDDTQASPGAKIPDFLVNDTAHPGLCGMNPGQGYTGDVIDAVGQGFGAKPDTVLFGAQTIKQFASWQDGAIKMNVPVLGAGKNGVQVSAGGVLSNAVSFNVLDKALSGTPTIASVTPDKGPQSEYITIQGKNFGDKVGKVIFTNKISKQDALGDTSFPPACAQGFWKDTSIIVKVPKEYLNKNQIQKADFGDWTISVVRVDQAASNKVDFVYTDGVAKPGICKITPALGPATTKIVIDGERLGGDQGNVTFTSKVDATIASWADSGVKANVPNGAKTGPVVATKQGALSNPVNFEVRSCLEQPNVCGKGEECCGDGACRASCPAASMKAQFAWQSSTGIIPTSPRVVEECSPKDPAIIPSPSPWQSRAGGDQVCVTPVTVTMRFTTHLDPVTVTNGANFKVKKCTAKADDPCVTTEDVKVAKPILAAANQDRDVVTISPLADLEPNTTYSVEVLKGVKGLGEGGATMDQDGNCPKGDGYCFRFKTRDSKEPCKVGSVLVAPNPYTVHDVQAPVNYSAVPVSKEDACLVLDCEKYNWKWEHGQDDSDGRAIFKKLQPGKLPNTIACHQTALGVSETGDNPVQMRATVLPDGVLGMGDLYVKFIPPHVVSYEPNCIEACINAGIRVKFSSPIKDENLHEKVKVWPCDNENCYKTGPQLPIPALNIHLDAADPTVLQIDPKDNQNATLLAKGQYYRVLLVAGDDAGIRGTNGVPLSDLNDPQGFSWKFRTKMGDDAFCQAQAVVVTPSEKYETQVGDREIFTAHPYSKPDACSAKGQELMNLSGTAWNVVDELVAKLYAVDGKTKLIDTGAPLPQGCDALCMATGAQGQFGKVAVCGNGIIETTDAGYCIPVDPKDKNNKNGKTVFGDACVIMTVGSKAGEECDPKIDADKERCDPNSCLWMPSVQIGNPKGTCGNGKQDFAEMCDFGSKCMGAAPKIADGTDCTANPNACTQAGGTCAPQPTHGCSPFCQHLGAKIGESTCGNGDRADGEDCDDGNMTNGDGCSSICLHEGSSNKVVSVCGNAVLEPGEACEKANVNDASFPAGCDPVACLHTGSSACPMQGPKLNCCGNAIVEAGEDCDGGEGCDENTCLLKGASAVYGQPSFCSDGMIGRGEQCEAGLPSNAPAFKKATNNAYPTIGVGAFSGDKLVDPVQIAEIKGDKDPDQNGLMSTPIEATVDKQKGTATYGLQCGFTDETSCNDGYGLTDPGCCAVRPTLSYQYPTLSPACRNTQVLATFNVPMNPGSIAANFEMAKQVKDANTCPNGTVQVTADFVPVKKTWHSWFDRAWNHVVAWVKGDPAIASIWCKGAVTGKVVQLDQDAKAFAYQLDVSLAATTTYRVKFMADYSEGQLGDNADLALKKGVRTAKGVVADPKDEKLTWSFTTGEELCAINQIQVKDESEQHPLLFIQKDESHTFMAQALSLQNGKVQLIQPVGDYTWTWKPWTESSGGSVVKVAALDPANKAKVQAQNLNGHSFVSAWVEVPANDKYNAQKLTIQGAAAVTVNLCSNPWPNLDTKPLAPFRDVSPNDDPDSTLLSDPNYATNDEYKKGLFYNFSTMYCRDTGDVASTEDDLPSMKINFSPTPPADKAKGILRQYLFTYDENAGALQKDGIGIRVASNPQHLSPTDWYRSRGFSGEPKPVQVDGYNAIEDGSTIYVSAANSDGPGAKIYSNIYLISHNPDASTTTLEIYKQMVANLVFNINLKQGMTNVCEQGLDPLLEPSAPIFDKNKQPFVCSSDYDCLKIRPQQVTNADQLDPGTGYVAAHCGSYKLKLERDTRRMADFALMSGVLDASYQANGTYPALSGGTYLQGLSVSRWASWDKELGASAGGKLPKDPVNQYLSCGRCVSTQPGAVPGNVCATDADCSSDETCKSALTESDSVDPQTCWDDLKHRYVCPAVGPSPSRVYQYRMLGGSQYELGAEFEIAKPLSGDWWEPSLPTDIKKCKNDVMAGALCKDDADCRPCDDPNTCKYPVVAGACQLTGGHLVYRDVCQSVTLGQSGVCGDGVVGSACSNDGKPCASDAECKDGGKCTATEACELNQSHSVACTTPDNKPGVKLQVCDQCKSWKDDPNLSSCLPASQCGNGKIDHQQVCLGGSNVGKSCQASNDCPMQGWPGVFAKCGQGGEVCDDGLLNGTYGHCNITCSGFQSYCGDNQLSPGEVCDNGSSNPFTSMGNGDYCDTKKGCDVNASCSFDCREKAPHCGDGATSAPEQCDGQTETTVLAICTSGNVGTPCKTNDDCGVGGVCNKGAPYNATRVCATLGKACTQDADCYASVGGGMKVYEGPCVLSTTASCDDVKLNKCQSSLKVCAKPNTTIDGASSKFDPNNEVVCQADGDCAKQPGGKTSCRPLQDLIVNCDPQLSQCGITGVPGTCVPYATAHIRSCKAPGAADQCTFNDWSSCTVLSKCGDGVLDAPAEECDNGQNNGDTKACTTQCKKNVCGDGKPFVGVEECDAGAQNGKVTCNAEYNGSCQSCSNMCKFMSISGGYCGDNVKGASEQCDGTEEVKEPGDQHPNCAMGDTLCGFLNSDCINQPCSAAQGTKVSCKALGYDFAVNGVAPKIVSASSTLQQMVGDTDAPPSFGWSGKMTKAELLMLEECGGLSWGKDPNSDGKSMVVSYTKTVSQNDFWECVKTAGQKYDISIQTKDLPQLVSCNQSCSFTGCAKCSDEVGNSFVKGQLVDAVYNQPVPAARVTVYYKGTLIKQVATDGDGKFTIDGLNNRPECSLYKVVFDKYDDNPCTGPNGSKVSCDKGNFPAWTQKDGQGKTLDVDENAQGGYWPVTVDNFRATQTDFIAKAGGDPNTNHILFFPRPAPGDAYFTVTWQKDWGRTENEISGVPAFKFINGWNNNHVVLPQQFAYTAPTFDVMSNASYPANFQPKLCDYSKSSLADIGGKPTFCVRDITYLSYLKGHSDLDKYPHAQLSCLHSVGEKVGGYGGNSSKYNGCPVEGMDACIKANPGNKDVCTKGIVFADGDNQDLDCAKTYWSTCDFFTRGPLTTQVRYTYFNGASEPIRMYWNWGDKSGDPFDDTSYNIKSDQLVPYGFKAVISTNDEIRIIDPTTSDDSKCVKDKYSTRCKYWYVGDLDPTTGGIAVRNLISDSQRQVGIAAYDYWHQGASNQIDPDGVSQPAWCMKAPHLFYSTDQACTYPHKDGEPPLSTCAARFGGVCQAPSWEQWARDSY